jgi:hypothetical protein
MKGWFNLRLIIFILVVFACIACSIFSAIWYFILYPSSQTKGNGVVTSEERTLLPFKKIVVNSPINLELSESHDELNLEISAEENLLPKIKTTISGDTLYIEYEKINILGLPTINPTKEVKIHLHYENLENIVLEKGSKLSNEGKIRVDKLNLNIKGDATANLDIFTNEFNITIGSTSKQQITVKGSAKVQNINLNGDFMYSAKELESKEVRVDISGNAIAEIRSDESLDIKINGAGKVNYLGSPKKLNQQINGEGSINQIK